MSSPWAIVSPPHPHLASFNRLKCPNLTNKTKSPAKTAPLCYFFRIFSLFIAGLTATMPEQCNQWWVEVKRKYEGKSINMWVFEVNVRHRWPCNLPMMPQGWINLGWCNFTVCELSQQKITALGPEIECLVISLASAWAKPLSHWHTWAKAGLSWTVQTQTKPLALTTPVSCKTKARAILIRPLIFWEYETVTSMIFKQVG